MKRCGSHNFLSGDFQMTSLTPDQNISKITMGEYIYRDSYVEQIIRRTENWTVPVHSCHYHLGNSRPFSSVNCGVSEAQNGESRMFPQLILVILGWVYLLFQVSGRAVFSIYHWWMKHSCTLDPLNQPCRAFYMLKYPPSAGQ